MYASQYIIRLYARLDCFDLQKSGPVRKSSQGLQSFRMTQSNSRRTRASAFRVRFSKSLHIRRQRMSQANAEQQGVAGNDHRPGPPRQREMAKLLNTGQQLAV